MAYPARYTPTREEIVEGCRQIRTLWCESERLRRTTPFNLPQPVELMVVHVSPQLRNEIPNDDFS